VLPWLVFGALTIGGMLGLRAIASRVSAAFAEASRPPVTR
jgi:hypothetical protein